MGRMVVRKATARDSAALAILYTHAFQPTTSRDVRRWMGQFPGEFLVAVADGVLAAA